MKAQTSAKLEMEVQLTVIDHLGIKMYSALPAVISELLANSWDADAEKVNITLPEGIIDQDSDIVVSDNGSGMTFEELNKAYLIIGRDRRQANKTDRTPELKRKVMGRKGLGKLSVFGVAREFDVKTIKSGHCIVFRMDLDKILKTPTGQKYSPQILMNGKTKDKSGTEITLRRLKRTYAINIDSMKRKLARRFSVIGSKFTVYVNRTPIRPQDRDLKSMNEYVWPIDECIGANTKWRVEGWIGTMPDPVDEETGKGVVIMARGKLIQEPTLFDIARGKQVAYAYMVGELHADFMDEEEDLIATHRTSALWESHEGQALRKWAQDKVEEISFDWAEKRRANREKVVRDAPKFKEWLEELEPRERKIVDQFIRVITRDESIPEERVLEIAEVMRDSLEHKMFTDLIGELDRAPITNPVKIIELFREWQLIELTEIVRIVKGRVATIEKLEKLIRTNAKEVPDIHSFLAEHPWILDPTWTKADDEVYYSKLLKEQFPDDKLDESDRRIDFICLGAGDTVHVVELKRPGRKITVNDLEQLESYAAFVRQRLGNAPQGRSYTAAAGYILAGEISDRYEVRDKIQRLEKDRLYVKKYEDLLGIAQRLHKEFIQKLEELKKKKKRKK
jgi:hypothetical protein